MPPVTTTIPLADMPRHLRALGYADVPSYRRIYVAVLDAKIPTERVAGRHYVRSADVPSVADAFGLRLPAALNAA